MRREALDLWNHADTAFETAFEAGGLDLNTGESIVRNNGFFRPYRKMLQTARGAAARSTYTVVLRDLTA
jgi:hypothetical protein